MNSLKMNKKRKIEILFLNHPDSILVLVKFSDSHYSGNVGSDDVSNRRQMPILHMHKKPVANNVIGAQQQ